MRVAELTVAMARADTFQKLQASPNKLSADQVAVLAAGGGGGRGGGGRGAGGVDGGAGSGCTHHDFPAWHTGPGKCADGDDGEPDIDDAVAHSGAHRYHGGCIRRAAKTMPELRSKADAMSAAAEAGFAQRTTAVRCLREGSGESANKLDDEQLASLVVWGGDYPQANGLEAGFCRTISNDHRGYVSLL